MEGLLPTPTVQGVPISWAQVVLTTASCMPPATLTRQRTTFAIPLQPQSASPKPARQCSDRPIYIQPQPSFAFHRAAVVLPCDTFAIVAISCLLHVKYLQHHHRQCALAVCRILSTLQRRDETMLCAVLPFLLRRRNSVSPLCLVRLQRCPHG